MTRSLKNRIFLTLLGFLTLLVIAGCSPVVKLEQSAVMETRNLNHQVSIGQTLVAHYDGLAGIDLYLEPVEPGDGIITLQLNNGPMEPDELAAGTIPLASISSPGFYPISFPTQDNSTQVYYYLVLRVEGTGSVNVGTAAGETYINGALYQDHVPQDAQLSFNLMYKPARMVLGLLQEGLTWIGYLLVAFFLFVIPGWALLSRLLPNWTQQDWVSKTALSTGVSLAIYPLLLLWTDVVGLHLGALYAWLPPLIGIIFLLWHNRGQIKTFSLKQLHLPQLTWPGITLVIILGMIFAVRFWVIRTLDAPIGSDSLHHTIAAQLIIDNKGLMHSWQPYSPLSTFTYHFGFHSAVAVFSWITNIPVLDSTLQVGQILNGLAALALYPLAKKVTVEKEEGSWTGMVLILFAGLMFQMPMFYVNWGRYTQLISQIILPATAIILWDLFDSDEKNCKLVILSSLSLAGLGLAHYRVYIFIIFIFPPLLFIYKLYQKPLRCITNIFWVGLGSLILFTPWLAVIISGKLDTVAIGFLSTPANEISPTVVALKSIDIFTYLPAWAWLLLPIAVGWGLWRREKGVGIISLWWFFVLIAANPSWINLPGEGIISHGAVITGAYLPVGVLLGVPVGTSIVKALKYKKRVFLPIFSVLLIILGVWGMLQQQRIVHPYAIQVTRPDIKASTWIKANIPPDATFLVNSATIFNADSWFVGTDAGWWLPLLTGRQTTTQHMMSVVEEEAQPGTKEANNNLTQMAIDGGLTHPDVISSLDTQGISHIYIGQRGKNILGTAVSTLIDSTVYKPIYHEDGVWILEIVP